MKRLGNFKDSAHFLLVINQSIQKTPPANISLLNGDLDSTLGVWTGKDPPLRAKKLSVRIKPFKSHRPYGRWNRNQGAWVP